MSCINGLQQHKVKAILSITSFFIYLCQQKHCINLQIFLRWCLDDYFQTVILLGESGHSHISCNDTVYTKYQLLADCISHSLEVLLISYCQRRGAEPQLSIGLILMAMLHCCILAGVVHSLLKLQFTNRLDKVEKLWFFWERKWKMKREKKPNQKPTK